MFVKVLDGWLGAMGGAKHLFERRWFWDMGFGLGVAKGRGEDMGW